MDTAWKKTIRHALLGGLLVMTVGLVGCGGGGGDDDGAATNPEEWAWLESAKADLDAKRADLAEARASLAAATDGEDVEGEGEEGAEGEGEEGAEASEPATEAMVMALENEIDSQSEEFMTRLINHINSLGMVEGEPLTPEQQKVIRMKSDEDIEVAQEWIEKGGDYRRAIDIYNMQLGLDPDYDRLKEALAYAEEMRYPSAEKFAEIEKGMTQSQVRDIIGPVNLHNRREYPDKNAIAWFYPKDPSLGSLPPSAVYFQEDDPKACTKLKEACEAAEDADACEAEAKADPACRFQVYQADYGATEEVEEEASE